MFRRSFKTLELPIRAFGFTAGFVGEEVRKEVEQLGVKAEFISLDEGVSRINLKLKSIDGTEINVGDRGFRGKRWMR